MSLKDLAVELFCQFDEENKGYITQRQLLNGSSKDGLFSEFSEGQILSIFELLDKEKKGVITLSDFTDAFVTDSNSVDQGLYTNGELTVEDPNRLSPYLSYDYRDEIYPRSPSPRVFEYGSTESLLSLQKPAISSPRTARSMSCQSYEDFDWDNTRKIDSLDLPVSKKRTDSLPSIMDPLILKRTKMHLLESKRWHSVDNGIDQCRLAFDNIEKNNNLKNNRLNGLTKSDSRIDKILIPLKRLSKDLSSSRNELNHLNQERCYSKKNKRKHDLESMFGSRDSVVSSIRCSSCLSLGCNDKYFSSNEDISSNSIDKRPRRYKSHTSMQRLLQIQKPYYMKQSSSECINSDDFDYSDSESNVSKHNGYASRESLSSNRNGFYLSCENVSSPIVDVSIESWETFLRKIGGVSMFAGNTKLRYLWKQIGSYQNDLLLPLEDCLKVVIEEHNFVLTKCQDVETTLHSKIEQNERAIDDVYEELEKTLAKELAQQEKQFCEREDSLRCEYKRTLEMKETAVHENLKYINEISERYESCNKELTLLQGMKIKNDTLYRQTVEEQLRTSTELDTMATENQLLKEQLKHCLEQNREFQECISHMNSTVKMEQEKYQSFVRKYEDLLEEKEFLEANVSNLSWENLELKNKSFVQKAEDMNFNASTNSYSPETVEYTINTGDSMMTSSPCPTKQRPPRRRKSQLMSLREEMDDECLANEILNPTTGDATGEEILEEVFDFEEKICDYTEDDSIGNEKTLEDELLDATMENNVIDDDEEHTIDENDSKNCTKDEKLREAETSSVDNTCRRRTLSKSLETPASVIRLATSIQTEFKVILCGDATVGKTSLIQRICFDTFQEEQERTFQIDCYPKKLQEGHNIINLLLWDTLGQERYKSLPRSYYRRCDIVLLTYDITNQQSFLNAANWLTAIRECTDENIPVLLVGNKLDDKYSQTVCNNKAECFAKENDTVFVQVSAKSGENIKSLLKIISSTLVNQAEYVMIQNCFDVSANSHPIFNGKKASFKRNPCCQ